ncbi:hypothetical protein Pint_25348 [Pistacia integerrima]|uniref:Uncharacterized protein n=1 Tax=Pistacia integerrima TaxID=434235 RepID=A0ACC0YHG7_9ROSI|nr:hypothetical protein Pint_25348 [Pistacia integerrima]
MLLHNKLEDEKKKKNKQTKQAEDIACGANENHVSNGDDNHSEVSETAELQNGGVDLSRHQHHSNGTEPAILAEAKKQQLLQRKVYRGNIEDATIDICVSVENPSAITINDYFVS